MMRPISFLLFFFFSCLVSFTTADYYDLDNSTIDYYTPVVRRVVAMYTPQDAPSLFSFNAWTGESYISFSLQFSTASQKNIHGSAEIIILAATDLTDIGYVENGQLKSYCCDPSIADKGIDGCTKDNIGSLIIKSKAKDRYQSYKAIFDNSNTASVSAIYSPTKQQQSSKQSSNPDSSFHVKETKEHIFIVSYCDGIDEKQLTYSGTTTWMNPYGYLPGRLYGFLPFYGFITIIYTILAIAWFTWYCLYYSEVFPVQNAISSVLLMCLFESFIWFIDYLSINYTGRRSFGLVLFAIFLTVFRLTMSRMLVVAVSLGYGVAKPSLGPNKIRILFLGFIYFLCEAALELVTRYAQTNEVAEHWRVILSLPVALLNAIFYWWIFIALQRTHMDLSQGGQQHKLVIYRQFTVVLVLSLIAAVIFAFYQIYFMTTHQFAVHWANLWLLDGGFSVILYTIILISILLLWKPSKDSRRYAYSELPINQNDLDDEDEFHSSLNDVELDNHSSHHQLGGGNGEGPDHADIDGDGDGDEESGPLGKPDTMNDPSHMFSIGGDDDKH